MTDHMDEALDLFKRVWNRKDLDAETQIEQFRKALQAAHESGKAEERERCLELIQYALKALDQSIEDESATRHMLNVVARQVKEHP